MSGCCSEITQTYPFNITTVFGFGPFTDNRILRADGTTGIQDSPATLTDAGALSGITTINMSGQLTSTLATGTAPFVVASTTLVTNLNADRVDGRHVGTSGNTIPALNAANTFSATTTFTGQVTIGSAGGAGTLKIFTDGAGNYHQLTNGAWTSTATLGIVYNTDTYHTGTPTFTNTTIYLDEEGEQEGTITATGYLSSDRTLGLPDVNGQILAKTGSVTDNAIARFDGTVGGVQNSGITINDSNHMLFPTAAEARFRSTSNRLYSPSTSIFRLQSAVGYTLSILGSDGSASGAASSVTIAAGAGGVVSPTPGNVTITGGAATSAQGGAITITAGDSTTGGGDITISALSSLSSSGILLLQGHTFGIKTASGAGAGIFDMDSLSANRTYTWPNEDGTIALLEADQSFSGAVTFDQSITIGDGSAGVDYSITFDGETNDGVLTWMEDEDYFNFIDSALMNEDRSLYFRNTNMRIFASSATNLNIASGASGGTMSVASDGDLTLSASTNDVVINGGTAGNIALTSLSTVTFDTQGAVTMDVAKGIAEQNLSVGSTITWSSGIFVNTGDNSYSQFGPDPNILSPNSTVDQIASIKQDSATSGTRRAVIAITEFTGSTNSGANYLGLNSFGHYFGSGADLTSTSNAGGLSGGRYGIRIQNQSGVTSSTIALASYISGVDISQSSGESFTLTELRGFYAEPGTPEATGGATATYTTVSQFYASDWASTATGSVANLYGLYVEELTDGTSVNEAVALAGANRITFRSTKGTAATEYIYSSAASTLDANAATTLNFRIGGTIEALINTSALQTNNSITLGSDGALSIGDTTNGLKQVVFADDTVGGGAAALPGGFRGCATFNATAGDAFWGRDNVFTQYYAQRVVTAGSTASDNSDDISNVYQGSTSDQYLYFDYAIASSGSNGIIIGSGLSSPDEHVPLIFQRTSEQFMLYLQAEDDKFVLDGDTGKAKSSIPIVEIAVNHDTIDPRVQPAADDSIDLGTSSLQWKDLYLSGTLNVGTNQTYSVSNLTTDRTYDANSTTTAELADVLGTLIDDLRTKGLVD